MKIFVIGINHKTSPIEMREKFYLTLLERELLLSELKNDPSVMAAVILSTCNRCEIYITATDDYLPVEIIRKLFCIKHHPINSHYQELFYVLEEIEAVKHFLRVACGLDSLILGEKQILGQIKEAVLLTRQNMMMDKFLNILSNFVMETGKKVRRETQIDFGGSSISWASVMMAQNLLGSLHDKTVLILGSGKMGRLALDQLNNKGVRKIYIMNRTAQKAEELAKENNGIAVPFWEMKEILPQVDVCICSASCTHYLIDKDIVQKTLEARNGRKLIFIDISVPRNIDPQISEIPNVFLLTVDDLDQVVQNNVQRRLDATEEAERIISNKIQEFYKTISKTNLAEDKKLFILQGELNENNPF